MAFQLIYRYGVEYRRKLGVTESKERVAWSRDWIRNQEAKIQVPKFQLPQLQNERRVPKDFFQLPHLVN